MKPNITSPACVITVKFEAAKLNDEVSTRKILRVKATVTNSTKKLTIDK